MPSSAPTVKTIETVKAFPSSLKIGELKDLYKDKHSRCDNAFSLMLSLKNVLKMEKEDFEKMETIIIKYL
jgi:hypothetical protein